MPKHKSQGAEASRHDPLRMYFADVNSEPLLSEESMKSLGRQMYEARDGLASIAASLSDSSRMFLLSHDPSGYLEPYTWTYDSICRFCHNTAHAIGHLPKVHHEIVSAVNHHKASLDHARE